MPKYITSGRRSSDVFWNCSQSANWLPTSDAKYFLCFRMLSVLMRLYPDVSASEEARRITAYLINISSHPAIVRSGHYNAPPNLEYSRRFTNYPIIQLSQPVGVVKCWSSCDWESISTGGLGTRARGVNQANRGEAGRFQLSRTSDFLHWSSLKFFNVSSRLDNVGADGVLMAFLDNLPTNIIVLSFQ